MGMAAKNFSSQQSFTLIELLIVIGILAVLVAAVVVALNPAQLLAQARDSKRMQDLSSLNQGINTLQALAPNISYGTASTVYVSLVDTTTTCANLGLPVLPASLGLSYHCVTSSATLQNTDGTGWLPVDFRQGNGVVQLGALPIDPVNTTTSGNYYSYITGGSFALTASFESSKYQSQESNDGGADPLLYEIGSNISLGGFAHGLMGYWGFEGNYADGSGLGNTGTAHGSTFTAGEKGQGIALNGSSWVQVPDASGAFDFSGANTVTAWVKYTGSSAYRGIVVKRDPGTYDNTNWQMDMNPSNVPAYTVFTAYGSSHAVGVSGGSLSGGAWHFLAGVYDKTNEYFYLDGALIASRPLSSSLYTNNIDVYIGGNSSSGYFVGTVDEVRLYDRALSASEISTLYSLTK